MANARCSADELIKQLALEPLPQEGGFFRETYRSPGLSCIYYLITNESFSALHSLASTELWHFYAGDPVHMINITPEGELIKHILGAELSQGQKPQVIVPAQTFQGARLLPGGSWALFGCTVSPAYEPGHYQHGQRRDLIQKFPKYFDVISRFSNS